MVKHNRIEHDDFVAFKINNVEYMIYKKDTSTLLESLLVEKIYQEIKPELPSNFTEEDGLEVASMMSNTYNANDAEYYDTKQYAIKKIFDRNNRKREEVLK